MRIWAPQAMPSVSILIFTSTSVYNLHLNYHTSIAHLLCTFMYFLPIMTLMYFCLVDTLTAVSYRQLQLFSDEEKQQLQDQITQLENSTSVQQLPTSSSSLSDHHQEGSHTQNGELKENHITIIPVLLIVPTNSCQTMVCEYC